MPLAVKINVALREQNCQTFGSGRVKVYALKGFHKHIFMYCIYLWTLFKEGLIKWNLVYTTWVFDMFCIDYCI